MSRPRIRTRSICHGSTLDGVRILCRRAVSGPYATLLMAIRADVILIESRQRRSGRQFPPSTQPSPRKAIRRHRPEGKKRASNSFATSWLAFPDGVLSRHLDPPGLRLCRNVPLNPGLFYVSFRLRPVWPLSRPAAPIVVSGRLRIAVPPGLNRRVGTPWRIAIGVCLRHFAGIPPRRPLCRARPPGKGKYIDVSMTDGLCPWMSVLAGPG